MRSLRETQAAFSAAIRSDDASVLAALVVDGGIAPERRIQVYRNNHRLAALGTMQATYPVTERLGGADWFRQSAAQYQQSFPSRSGDLQYLGERYPEYLRSALAGTLHAYFADVAALEWAYQVVLTAEERAPVNHEVLRAIAPQDHERLVFVPRPALRLVESEFPLFAIWDANQPSVQAVSEIRLDAGPSRVLLIRRKDHVEVRELSAGCSLLLQQWQLGTPLGPAAAAVEAAAAAGAAGAAAAAVGAAVAAAAATTATAATTAFDLQLCLRELLTLEVVADIVCF
jgi:hypothetical protein